MLQYIVLIKTNEQISSLMQHMCTSVNLHVIVKIKVKIIYEAKQRMKNELSQEKTLKKRKTHEETLQPNNESFLCQLNNYILRIDCMA